MAKWSDPEVLDQVRDFYRKLPDDVADAFDAAVELLTEQGPALGRPVVGEVATHEYPKAIRDRLPHLKELRFGSVRVLFTFGPDRVPVLLVAGDKAGTWKAWYRDAIKEAAREYGRYLEEMGLGD
jgi:hypothetical protein